MALSLPALAGTVKAKVLSVSKTVVQQAYERLPHLKRKECQRGQGNWPQVSHKSNWTIT